MDSWVLIAAIAVAVLGALAAFVLRSSSPPSAKPRGTAPAATPAKTYHTRQEEVDAAGITVSSS
jgi:hypothetical protein